MHRSDWLLLLIAARPARAIDPVRVQKGLFLLAMGDVVPEAERYAFTPYSYGPMSRDIYADSRALEARGAVASVPVDGFGWRALRATQTGIARATGLSRNLPAGALAEVDVTREIVDGRSFSELLGHVYDQYPEYATRSVFRRS